MLRQSAKQLVRCHRKDALSQSYTEVPPIEREGRDRLDLAERVSDYTGATALLDDLPQAQWLLGNREYA